MKGQLKRAVLLVLEKCDGVPMPEDVLLGAVRLMVRPQQPTVSDAEAALRECESQGYAQGATDGFSGGRSWTLTEKGVHQARKLN